MGDLWWQAKGDDRAKAVVATIDSYSSEQEARRKRALRNLRLYEGRQLGDLNPRSYFTDVNYAGPEGEPYRVNLARALVATAVAKIAGKQRPKAQFCSTDADWSIKRKAKKKERFVEAAMMARQGYYHDAYAVGLAAFRDCCVADIGILKWWADKAGRRIAIDRVIPWEFIVDPNEARNGMPLNFFHDYGYDRFKLAERFPDNEEAIMSAPAISDNYVGGIGASGVRDKARLVRVSEAWRMALSEDKPGVHALCVGGVDLTKGEEWTCTFPPFEFMVWEPWMMGMFGTSLVDIAAPLCEELNASFERWARSEKLGSNQIGFYDEGSVDKQDLESNETSIWIPVKKGATFPPTLSPSETMGAASIQWQSVVKALCYEIPGVSQMDATARKEPGITADVAIRTMQNIGSERFAVQWQQYERVMAIGGTRQILARVKELEDDSDGKGVLMRFPAGGVLEELNSKDLGDYDVPDEAIQIYAVSGLVNTPADRLDLAEKLYTMGVLSPEAFKRVIQYKDIDGEISSEQSELLKKYIERWLDAEEGKDPPLAAPVSFKWMTLEEAVIQVGRAAMQAELDDCPDYNMKFFLNFLALCDREIQKRAAAQAQLQAAASGSAPALQGLSGSGGPPPPPGPSLPAPGPSLVPPMQGAA